MEKRPLNLPFLGLQALLILIDCIAVAYVSPILVSFGYSPMRIGRVMTLAALAATLARPVWGYLNDHFACARQVTLLATAAGISCYCLLVFGGDARPAVTAVAVMGLNVTIVCMMNFVDAWALRLISEGYVLNYGATRAGGSLSFALGAMVFGWAPPMPGFHNLPDSGTWRIPGCFPGSPGTASGHAAEDPSPRRGRCCAGVPVCRGESMAGG